VNEPTDAQNEWGQTPLLLAAQGGYHDIMHLLIHRGCSVDKSDKRMWMPLLSTVEHGDILGCKLLMDNGADCSVSDHLNMMTTWAAAFCGHHDLLRYLILHGNPPLSVPGRCMMNYEVARTPLCVAIMCLHLLGMITDRVEMLQYFGIKDSY